MTDTKKFMGKAELELGAIPDKAQEYNEEHYHRRTFASIAWALIAIASEMERANDIAEKNNNSSKKPKRPTGPVDQGSEPPPEDEPRPEPTPRPPKWSGSVGGD